jgi:outer membrane protein OmpA-like peptidoglycan-associated protein
MQRAIEGFVWSLIIMHSSAYSTALRGPNIHFDTDKAEVINQNTVREFAGRVAGRAKNIRLYCYTDGRASFEYNVELANKRCKSVAALLNEAGLDPQQLIIIGERHPEVGS